jgi:DNA-binding Xre family transcriptional regulator
VRKASYKKLWKLLIDRDMNKKAIVEAANISYSSLSKMSRGETVNVDILIKICNALDCEMGDIMELVVREDKENVQQN